MGRLDPTTAKRYLLPSNPCALTVSAPVPAPVPTQPPPLARRQHTSFTGQLHHTLQGHSDEHLNWNIESAYLPAIAISPHGDYIVSAMSDNMVRIWGST